MVECLEKAYVFRLLWMTAKMCYWSNTLQRPAPPPPIPPSSIMLFSLLPLFLPSLLSSPGTGTKCNKKCNWITRALISASLISFFFHFFIFLQFFPLPRELMSGTLIRRLIVSVSVCLSPALFISLWQRGSCQSLRGDGPELQRPSFA